MTRYIALMAFAGILQGCFSDPESPRGFRLPDGDADQGLQAFMDLQCAACHAVPQLDITSDDRSPIEVVLGGDVTRVKTYGELVTSIINPSHRLAPGYQPDPQVPEGESPMALVYLNEVMTVQQLVDLVVFLQPLYEVTVPPDNPYRYTYQ